MPNMALNQALSLQRVADLKAFLSGSWRIDRCLLDRRHSVAGKMIGEARFSPETNSLLYQERGSMTFGSYEGSVEQTHRYEFPDGTSRASVYFHDGRPFHELDLSRGLAFVAHACGADFYQGRFTALDDRRWQSAWNVAGPRKDQSIRTLYTRIG
jgi:hypothetical protein